MGRDLLPAVEREKSYQPQKWTGTHRRMVALEAAGYKPKDIASMTESTVSRVSIVLNDPRADLDRKDFASKVIEHVSDVQLKIAFHADEALEEILDSMRTCEDVKVRQRAAFDILDRAGYTPVRKEVRATVEQIPNEIASRMEQALQEMEAIEADYEIVS